MNKPLARQDAKLHTLRWHLLPRLGAALLPLARRAGAARYADHYLRDLGPGLAHGARPGCAPLPLPPGLQQRD